MPVKIRSRSALNSRKPVYYAVVTDCRLFKAGIVPAFASEIDANRADQEALVSVLFRGDVLGGDTFLDSLENIPLIVGHRSCIEARHKEGHVRNARFDGLWVIGDVVVETNAAAEEICRHGVRGLSLEIQSRYRKAIVSDLHLGDDASIVMPDYVAARSKATHLAIVPHPRVQGAMLNLS
ncbi:DUF2213 domain-containing protein [Paraburkholderia sp. BL10I2N1]|uniref:DUF2213 domain-containing protein n=1 Tax=Paraburkholderia sp. BL10I2N1 TaxID=1938796 RepID=UPI00105FB762|nr:DUF2213 domain-containing protein [Paraburkholderia sp. BL10I2N1]TDN69094.1 uncharacterized protein DUF2213 [Paraburkholderia sp. BL10I2N1]